MSMDQGRRDEHAVVVEEGHSCCLLCWMKLSICLCCCCSYCCCSRYCCCCCCSGGVALQQHVLEGNARTLKRVCVIVGRCIRAGDCFFSFENMRRQGWRERKESERDDDDERRKGNGEQGE